LAEEEVSSRRKGRDRRCLWYLIAVDEGYQLYSDTVAVVDPH